MGFISPALITCTGIRGRTLNFQAVQRELTAHIETGRMLAALAVEHPFILEARERMNIDQFRSQDAVVFDEGHLNKLSPTELIDAIKRSATSWRP
ncbi:hypothetical protein [Aliiroseovarius sp. S1339]|uniref:hypothetical protein n=1 Tax=Aliiroseovarius sp. S1339 TaxID=2936990 RepID=UPI0020C00AD6|nr:hypothetical protein [Aliiroseovarius sp. S1339]